jgi:hypothetical protein
VPELKEREQRSARPYTLSSAIIEARLDRSTGIKC